MERKLRRSFRHPNARAAGRKGASPRDRSLPPLHFPIRNGRACPAHQSRPGLRAKESWLADARRWMAASRAAMTNSHIGQCSSLVLMLPHPISDSWPPGRRKSGENDEQLSCRRTGERDTELSGNFLGGPPVAPAHRPCGRGVPENRPKSKNNSLAGQGHPLPPRKRPKTRKQSPCENRLCAAAWRKSPPGPSRGGCRTLPFAGPVA